MPRGATLTADGEPSRPLSLRRRLIFSAVAVVMLLPAILLVFAQITWVTGIAHVEAQLEERRGGRFADEGAIKMLFLGDSFTAGELAESEVGYWAWLPEELAALDPPIRAETVSLALAGSTTWYMRDQLQRWLHESGQAPDYVIALAGANDRWSLHMMRRYVRDGGPHPAWVRGLFAMPTGVLFALQYPGRNETLDSAQVEWGPLDDYLERGDYPRWLQQDAERVVQDIEAISTHAGARLLRTNYLPDQRWPVGAGGTDPVPTFRPRFTRPEARDAGLLTEDVWHMNDAGSRRYAREFAAWFVEEVLSGERPDPSIR